MALFAGEDMVDVQTPDGRTLTLPRSVVPTSMLQQQIAGGPITSPQHGGPVTSPQEIPGGFTPPDFGTPANPYESGPAPDTGVVEMGEPETTPVTMMEPLDVKSRPGVMKKLKTQQAKQAASPQGKLDAAQGQQNAAANAEAEAIVGAADVQAAEDAVVAEAYEERNTQIDGYVVKRAADMQKVADEQEKKYGEVTSLKTKIANFKVDRTHDSKTMAAIGMILAALGTAINNTTYKRNDENPALKIFYEAIDRKVAGQMADLDQMGKIYGMTKDEVDMLKEKSKSKLEMWNTMIAGETEKGIRIIQEITARSASEKTKANAKMFIAQLQGRVAEKTMEATRWGLDYGQKEQAEKNQNNRFYSGLKQADRHHADDMQQKREDRYADLQKALAGDKARGDEAMFKARMEADKEAREAGIVGADNQHLLTPAGRAKMEAAAKLEAEAQQTEDLHKNDPMGSSIKATRVQALRQKAAELRGDANSFDVVKMRDTAEAKAVSKKYAAAQTMMDTVDEIKMLYEQEGRRYVYTTKGQQELQSKMSLLSVAAKDAWELGAWDKGSAALVASIIGKDPTDGWDPGAIASNLGLQIGKDPEGFKSRLDAVTVKLEQDVKQQILKGGGKWDGKDALFTRKKSGDMNTPTDKMSQNLTQKRSGVELQKKAEDVGVVGKTARAVGYPMSDSHAEEAEGAQSVKRPGLSTDQEPDFDGMVAEYKKGNTHAGDELVAKVVNTAKDRPDLAIALIHNLEEHAPSLAVAAKAGLPKDSEAEKQMTYEANSKIGRAPVPTRELAAMVVNTVGTDGRVTADEEYRELARRAGKGDPEAKRAIADIVSTSNKNKAAPQPWDTRSKPKPTPVGSGGPLGPILPNRGR